MTEQEWRKEAIDPEMVTYLIECLCRNGDADEYKKCKISVQTLVGVVEQFKEHHRSWATLHNLYHIAWVDVPREWSHVGLWHRLCDICSEFDSWLYGGLD